MLGRGATATVRRFSTNSAVKLISKERVYDNSHDLAQLIAERRAHSIFSSSPYILKLREAWQTDSHFALVTDLAHYGDLHQIQSQLPQQAIAPHIARILFAELVVALELIHAKGWLYRDMKPSNVLVNHAGHVRLADLGLMKRIAVDPVQKLSSSVLSSAAGTDSESDDGNSAGEWELQDDLSRRLKPASSFVGTRRFMSPEVYGTLGRKREYGTSADIWSLGVTLYVLLTGRYPFDGDDSNALSLSMSVAHDNVDMTGIPQDAADLLEKMLQKDALERASLGDIRRHPWMKDVDWNLVRVRGVLDDVSDKVVGYLREHGVMDVDRRIQADSNKQSSEDESQRMSLLSSLKSAKPQTLPLNWNLLGFEYFG